MDIWQFIQAVGVVIIGNLLSACVIWFVIQATRLEKEGRKAHEQPATLGLVGLIACAFVVGSVLLIAQ